jgi:hypothetical protein
MTLIMYYRLLNISSLIFINLIKKTMSKVATQDDLNSLLDSTVDLGRGYI